MKEVTEVIDNTRRPGITPQDVLERIDYTHIANLIPNKEYDFVDMFCGAGGMSYGFHQMADLTGRFRWAGAIDIDKHAIDTYERNYGHRPSDVNLGEAEIEEITDGFYPFSLDIYNITDRLESKERDPYRKEDAVHMESLPPDYLVPYPSEDIEYTEFRS